MYLNVVQLAESLGVEESAIRGWIRDEGLPAIEDRGRLLFDRVQVAHWAAERGFAAKAGFLAPPRSAPNPGRGLEALLHVGGIWRDVADVVPTLEKILDLLPGATPEVRRILRLRLHGSGGITWAPVGGGLALPHLRAHVTLGRDSGLLALLFLREPLACEESAPDAVPITRLCFFVAPSPRAHLEVLAQLSSSLNRGRLRPLLLSGAPDAQIYQSLSEATAGAPKAEARQ